MLKPATIYARSVDSTRQNWLTPLNHVVTPLLNVHVALIQAIMLVSAPKAISDKDLLEIANVSYFFALLSMLPNENPFSSFYLSFSMS